MMKLFSIPHGTFTSTALAVLIVCAQFGLIKAANAGPNLHGQSGEPSLIEALQLPETPATLKIEKVLLAQHVDPNCVDRNGEPAIDLAIEKSRTTHYTLTIQQLIDAGARVDIQDRTGRTPLMIALETGQTKIAATLLRYGAATGLVDNRGGSALTVLAQSERQFEKTHAKGRVIRGSARTAIQSLTNAILQGGALTSDTQGKAALLLAAATGNEGVLNALLAAGADPNSVINLPLSKFVIGASQEFAEPGQYQKHPVGHLSLGLTPLMYSAYNNNSLGTLDLLRHRASVNIVDSDGRSALMYAAESGSSSAVTILLRFGANVRLKDKFGDTALTLLATKGVPWNQQIPAKWLQASSDQTVAAELIARGASPWLTNDNGESAMSIARKNHRNLIAIVRWRQARVKRLGTYFTVARLP